jgi:hypothetical protein
MVSKTCILKQDNRVLTGLHSFFADLLSVWDQILMQHNRPDFLPENALSFLYYLFLCRRVKLNVVLQCKDFDKFHW